MKASIPDRYVKFALDGIRSGRLAIGDPRDIRKDMAGASEGYVVSLLELCGYVEPLLLPALEKAKVFGWTDDAWALMQESVPACCGATVDAGDTPWPELWIVPPRPDHRVSAATGILWIPVDEGDNHRAVLAVLLLAPADSPYRPVAVLPVEGILHGQVVPDSPVDFFGNTMQASDSLPALLAAGTAFLRSKVARVNARKSGAKGKRRDKARRETSVVYLRQFEELEERARTKSGRRSPRAHWVGLPAGFPRRRPGGAPGMIWVDPFVRGLGFAPDHGTPSSTRRVAIVNR